MKCPNCKVEKEYILENNKFKRQYSRGSGYLKCIWCEYIITNDKFILEVMDEYNLL